jgi:hypothetical protein
MAEDASVPPGASELKRRPAWIWLSLLLFLLLLSGLGLLWRSNQSAIEGSIVVWQPGAPQGNRPPGLLTRTRYAFLRLVTPIWRRIIPPATKPQVSVEGILISFEGQAAAGFPLPSLCATGEAGVRAWIFSATQCQELRHYLATNPKIVSSQRTRIATFSGGPSTLTMVGNPGGHLQFDLVPKISGDSLRLTVGVWATEAPDPTSASSLICTNLAAACRATVTNEGGLLLTGDGATNATGTQYWFFIKPSIIDARGNLIHL